MSLSKEEEKARFFVLFLLPHLSVE